MRQVLALALFLAGANASNAAQLACHDLLKHEPSSLTGELQFKILPGPPEYEDVQSGDIPEPTYLLELDADICLEGDEDFADPEFKFRQVHLVPGEGIGDDMAAMVGHRVTVDISDRWAAHTIHHRAPLVAVVGAISAADDPGSEHGSAATVVRAFYLALKAGNGGEAARFVVPEKASTGPLSGASLSGYYGGMEEPLELTSLRRKSEDTFLVRYAFRKGSMSCVGRAEVTTENRNGKNYIQRIKALGGC